MGSSAAHFRAVGRRGVSGLEVRHLPDPAKLRDLAARWAVLGAQLQALATTVEVEADAPPALSGWDWTGQARDAAATAGGHVHDHVNKVAAEVQNMADGLNETAGKVEEEIRKEKAVFIATILSVPIMGASLVADAVFGIFQSVIAVVDALIVNVARYVGVGLEASTAGSPRAPCAAAPGYPTWSRPTGWSRRGASCRTSRNRRGRLAWIMKRHPYGRVCPVLRRRCTRRTQRR